MAKPSVMVHYEKCNPENCDSSGGICVAIKACKRKLIEQEDQFETPIIFSADLCQGCCDCIEVCPFDALYIVY